jgi:hypothetical protein
MRLLVPMPDVAENRLDIEDDNPPPAAAIANSMMRGTGDRREDGPNSRKLSF